MTVRTVHLSFARIARILPLFQQMPTFAPSFWREVHVAPRGLVNLPSEAAGFEMMEESNKALPIAYLFLCRRDRNSPARVQSEIADDSVPEQHDAAPECCYFAIQWHQAGYFDLCICLFGYTSCLCVFSRRGTNQ